MTKHISTKMTRRRLLAGTTALSALALTPGLASTAFAAHHKKGEEMAGDMMSNMIMGSGGEITIHPVGHASLALKGGGKVIYADPVGDVAAYKNLPKPDLILVTHEHGDHYNVETLGGLMGDNTLLLTNPAVYGKLPTELKSKASEIGNGDSSEIAGLTISAIPAYNTTQDRKKYHPQGRDNGYVFMLDGKRIYIGGDTEDIPEMRALESVDLAFVPMNLPFTMDVNQAASAVAQFKPKVVYPYHYRGSDTAEFKKLVAAETDAVEVRLHDWYG